MDILYFARIRENIGHATDRISLPEDVTTVGELVDHLRRQGENYQAAFANEALLRTAVNQAYVDFDHPVSDSDEVAFFPPMTGG